MRERVLALAAVAALLFSLTAATVGAEEHAGLIGAGKTVFVDPGHGGIESGAVHVGADGKVDLIEKDLNLRIALKLRVLLQRDGFRVAMSRESDASANTPPVDRNGDGRASNRDEYQAVVDLANAAQADLFVSIHNNGSPNKEASGTEVWYSPTRPFADRNLLFARLLQANLVTQIRALGYNTVDRGIRDDTNFRIFRGLSYEIFVLGVADDTRFHPRAANMPGALGESLFLSNEADAALLLQGRTLDAIAQGYRDAIVQYFARLAQGGLLEWPRPGIVPDPSPGPTPPPAPVRPRRPMKPMEIG